MLASPHEFRTWVASATDFELTSFVLGASRDLDIVNHVTRATTAIELRNLYRYLDPAAQERFKLACLIALQEWDPPVHGLLALQSLGALVAYIRLERAVPIIAEHLESTLLPRIEPWPSESEVNGVSSYLIAVMRGFTPSKTVQSYFERWFFEHSFTSFVGQFFLGLCACDRRNTRDYFSRLAQVASTLQDSPLHLPHFPAAIVEVLGIQAISKVLNELPSEAQRKILWWLVGGESPPVRLLIDPETRELGLVSCDAQLVPTLHPLGENAREVSWKVWTELENDPVQSVLDALR
jgi:hypothetical protein